MFISIGQLKRELVGNTIQSVEAVIADKTEVEEITLSINGGSQVTFVAQYDHNCQRESIAFWKEA